MNKFLYSLIISIFIFVFAGCETEGEDIDMRFETCTVSFVQQELRSSYEVYFNGEKSINRSTSVKKNSTLKLEVYKIGEKQPELSQEITLDNSKDIELLKLVGRDIAISSSLEEYTTFTPIISYFNPNTDLYTVTFNNGELSNKVKNYIAEADLSGTLKIVRNVLDRSEGEEADPESRQYTKIRFFYTADAFPGHDKLKLVVYLMDLDAMQFTAPIATIDLEAGKISEYIQIDNDAFGQGVVNGVYDLIDESGNMIVNNLEHFNTSIPIGTSDNKFMTFRFMDPSHQGGDNVQCNFILSTPWK